MGPVTTKSLVDCCYQYDHSFWCIGYAGFLDESYLLCRSYSSKKNQLI